jgi:mRNA-degrading endonuclease RelE of RelBE toxin-antitoxin system
LTDAGWVFSDRAERDIRRLDHQVARRVVAALDRLCGEPPVGDVTHLTGSNPPEWRLRVGDWRVRFARDDAGTIIVTRVLPRGRAYRN